MAKLQRSLLAGEGISQYICSYVVITHFWRTKGSLHNSTPKVTFKYRVSLPPLAVVLFASAADIACTSFADPCMRSVFDFDPQPTLMNRSNILRRRTPRWQGMGGFCSGSFGWRCASVQGNCIPTCRYLYNDVKAGSPDGQCQKD